MIGSIRGARDNPGVRPALAVVSRDLQIDRGLVAVELLPDHKGVTGAREQIGPARIAVCLPDRNGSGKGPAAVARTRIEQALAVLSAGVPCHVVRAGGRNRKARAVMRTGIDLPIVNAHPIERPRRPDVGKADDSVVADAALEDVPECDHRPAGTGESEPNAAALASVIGRQPGFRIGLAAVLGGGEEQAGAVISTAALLRRNTVALVQPGREHRSVCVELDRLEALALGAWGDRAQLGKAPAAIAR